jgi:hypothetical protein
MGGGRDGWTQLKGEGSNCESGKRPAAGGENAESSLTEPIMRVKIFKSIT